MSFADDKKHWEEKILKPAITKFPERSPEFYTPSGIPVPPVLGPEETNYAAKSGFPGEYPFTRGVQPSMYRGRFWTMRQ
jgi:methylmalonyl-CoA mutase, N-terminal domain